MAIDEIETKTKNLGKPIMSDAGSESEHIPFEVQECIREVYLKLEKKIESNF